MKPSALMVFLVLGWSSTAWSFCRTQTCDEQTQTCRLDANGCPSGGTFLAWPSNCVPFAVQRDGSSVNDVSAAQIEGLVEDAFATWVSADCGGGEVPSLGSGSQGLVQCAEPEFNCADNDVNFNTVMFRDEGWPYDRDALAITTVSVDMRTGEILDADMELNSTDFAFSLPGETPTADLLSVLTHEAGHMLGLAHSDLTEATMFAFYDPRSTSIRDLDDDDADGVCEVFGATDSPLECSINEAEGNTDCLGETPCSSRPASGSCALVTAAPERQHSGAWLIALGIAGWMLRRQGRGHR